MMNLIVEIRRDQISVAKLSKVLSVTEECVDSKLNDEEALTVGDVLKLRAAFFPGLTIDYLVGRGGKNASFKV